MAEYGKVEMIERNLDGVYFRVLRDGKYKSICFSDLTADERDEILEKHEAPWLRSLCGILADVIREIGDQFDIKGVNEVEDY